MTVDMSDFDKAMERYEGAMDKAEEIARKMRDMNVDMPIIAEATGLSEEQIRELQFACLSKFGLPSGSLFLSPNGTLCTNKTCLDPAFKEFFDSEDALKDFFDGVLGLDGDDKIKKLTFTFDKSKRFRVLEQKTSLFT